MTLTTVPARYLVALVAVIATVLAAVVADRHLDALAVGWCAELCGPSGAADAYYYRGECDCDDAPIRYGAAWSR